MKEEKDGPNRPAYLRRQAEEIAQEKAEQIPENLDTLSSEEARRLLHELQVHQIELEMQNEELRRTQAELEASRARYFELFDLAPVGYFTLSEQGLILEANLTAAGMLGAVRAALIKQPLWRFILPEDQDIYYRYRTQIIETSVPQVCELRINASYGRGPLLGTAGGDRARKTLTARTMYRTVVGDITERKQAEQKLHQVTERERERAEELATVLQAVPACVWIAHDPECLHITGNHAADELLRLPYGAEALR